MKRKWCASLLAVLMLGSLLTGCGEKGGSDTKVRLNEVTHSVFYAPQYAAMELGYFADEGLEIELTNGGGADKVMTAVISGQSDIGLAGGESCIYVYNQGKADYPRIFAQLTKRDGSFLVGRTDGPFSWEDLRGKTIIGGRLGGMPEMTPGVRAAPERPGAGQRRECGHLGAVQHDGRSFHRRQRRLRGPV